jgi:hypothetical protein
MPTWPNRKVRFRETLDRVFSSNGKGKYGIVFASQTLKRNHDLADTHRGASLIKGRAQKGKRATVLSNHRIVGYHKAATPTCLSFVGSPKYLRLRIPFFCR